MALYCYNAIKGFDDRIAERFSDYNKHQIATLRGLYKDVREFDIEYSFLKDSGRNIQDLTDDEIDQLADDLTDFLEDLKKSEFERLNDALYNPSASFRQLKDAFTSEQRIDRINLIADFFTEVVDSIQEEHEELTRDEILRGFVDANGEYQYGIGYIYQEIRNKLQWHKEVSEINAESEVPTGEVFPEVWAERARQWDLTIRNLAALIIMANRVIRENEGYNIAAKLQFVRPSTQEDEETAQLSFTFDPEVEVKESYQQHKDSLNPFAQVSKSVRRLLGSLTEFDTNNPKYMDDLGRPRRQRPSKVHQDLMVLFRGIQSERDIITKLENCDIKAFPYKQELLNQFNADPILRTQFFVDFSKVAQLYAMVNDKNDGNGSYISILNIVSRKNAFNKYLAKLKTQALTESAGTIFKYNKENKSATTNVENINTLTNFILENVEKVYYKGKEQISKEEYDKIKNGEDIIQKQLLKEGTNIDSLYDDKNSMASEEVANIYGVVFDALGIDIQPITMMYISSDRNLRESLNLAIANLPEGLGSAKDIKDFSAAITAKAKGQKKGPMQEAIEKIYKAVDIFESNKVINRARFQDKDYFTDVQSSYLGRFRDRVQNLINKPNVSKKDVKEFFISEFGSNSVLYDGENFRVKWLQDLVNGPIKNKKSFIRNFTYARLLGDNRQEFENFGERTQTLANLSGFFNNSDKAYGYYPTFILGDSGVQKYIYAPKYDEKTIIDSFVEAAFQDIEVYKQLIAQKNALEKAFESYYDNLPKPDNLSEEDAKKFEENAKKKYLGSFYGLSEDRINKFALLPFLNGYKLDIKSPTIERDIRTAIEEHLIEAFNEYKLNITADGVLDKDVRTSKGGTKEVFKHSLIDNISKEIYAPKNQRGYNSIFKTTSTLDANLWSYFLNHRMATLNQIQIMTVSPAFYGKNANGNGGLDGNSTEFQKRYKQIHATGIRLSPDAVNPNTKERYSKNYSQRVVYYSDPKTDSKETNPEFYEALKAFDEENGTNLAEKYRKSDSTDGQSIRTLDSYMQIMGMSGKMTKELLDIWQDINDIRADIRDNARDLTKDEEEELKKLNKKFSEEPLTKEEHERLSKLKEIQNGITREQVAQLESLMVALQPIKSFIYTWEEVPNSAGGVTQIPVQIKHSECVIIPELLPKNSKMRHMMEWAEENKVDMLSSDTCVKVGNYGNAEIHSIDNKDDLYASLSGAFVHELSYDGYVIQQNNPEHVRESRLIGTQGRKVSFSDLRATDSKGNLIDYSNYLEDSATDEEGITSFNLGKGHGIVSNDNKNKNINNKEINRLYVGVALANILQDLDKFTSKIDSPEKVRNLITQMTMNADRTNMENILGLEAVRNIEDKVVRDFLVPLFEGGVEYDNAALLLSLFKNQVNKQKMMGGSAIQASAFGLSSMDESDTLKFIKDPNNKANILYAEAEIPWDLSYTDATGQQIPLEWNDWLETDGKPKLSDEIIDKNDPRYSKYLSYTDTEGNVHIPLIEQRFPGILDIIATRIPTEAKYSMIPLKVVRFTHKVAGGGTIRLPLQGVTMAGFDYDIDKLYLQRREYTYTGKLSEKELQKYWDDYYNEHLDLYNKLVVLREQARVENADKARLYQFGKNEGKDIKRDFSKWLTEKGLNIKLESYDYSLTPWDKKQSRVGRNNLLFQLNYARLQDPNTMQERFTPGGFDTVKEASADMREIMGIPEGKYDYSDPYTLVVYNQQNQIAGKLIGIFANQNSNAAMASLLSKLELKTPIAFGKFIYGGKKNLLEPNTLTKELLAASVDAVKDPCLSALNFNTITATSAAMLTRLGYSFRDIGLLFNQPEIRRLTKECLDNGITDVVSQIDEKIAELNKENLIQLSDPTLTSGLSSNVLEDSLRRLSHNETLNNSDKVLQIKALSLFKDILNASNELNQFVTATKFTASNSVQSTLGDMYAQQIKVDNYLRNVGKKESLLDIVLDDTSKQISPIDNNLDINNREEYAQKVLKNPFGYEQVMYDANKAALRKIGKYFPYEAMKEIRTKMANACIGNANGDTINAFHKSVIKYNLSLSEDSPFNPEGPNSSLPNNVEVNNIDYYKKYMPYRIQATLEKYPDLKNNPLFALSEITIDSKNNVVFKLVDSGAISPTDKENITSGWEQLIELGMADLAVDLYLYNYYQSGFGFGVIGFNHLAPVKVKQLVERKGFNYLDNLWRIGNMTVDDYKNINFKDLMRKFIQDNPNNYQIVYTPSKEIRERLFKAENNRAPMRLDVDNEYLYIQDNQNTKPFQLRESDNKIYWKPAIKILTSDGRALLYIADSQGEDFNSNGMGEMRYRLLRDSEGVAIDTNAIESFNSDVLGESPESHRTTPKVEDIVDFGNHDINTMAGLRSFLETYANIANREVSEDQRVNPVEFADNVLYGVSDVTMGKIIFNDLKQRIIESAKENGFKAKLNNEFIC